MELNDTTVLVTGAASGIGTSLAVAAARHGARKLALFDLDAAGAQRVAEAIEGPEVMSVGVDLADEHALSEAIVAVSERLGPIDVVFSNAGILVPGGIEVPTEAWRDIIDVNVLAHVWLARAVVPSMLERGGGWFVVTASAAGLLSQIGSAPYSVTKHAALAFAEWLSITHGDDGLGVAALCPQAVETAMTAGVPGGGVAGIDGMLGPDEVAEVTIAALREERFLILPHPEVAEYARRRADDPERWLAGMRRLQARHR